MTTTTATVPGPVRTTPTPSPATGRARSRARFAALFLAPTVIGIALFTVLPIVASFVLAFFRWDVISAPEWTGADNFADIAADPTVRVAFLNTILSPWDWPSSCRAGCRDGCGRCSARSSSSR